MLFVAERNIKAIGLVNFANARYFDDDIIIRLDAFVKWALSIGWELPVELAKIATAPAGRETGKSQSSTPDRGNQPPWKAEGAPSATPPAADATAKRDNARNKPRGPRPGSIGRFDASDRALFSEIERLIQREHLSPGEAAQKLAGEGKVAGRGTEESRVRRLARLYRTEREQR